MGHRNDIIVRDTEMILCGYSNNKPPVFDGLYQPFMVMRGMVYCYTNIIPHCTWVISMGYMGYMNKNDCVSLDLIIVTLQTLKLNK